MKRVVSLVLCAALAFGMAAPAFAADKDFQYGLREDGGYYIELYDVIEYGLDVNTKTPKAKPGVNRKTETVTETFRFDYEDRTITYEAVFEEVDMGGFTLWGQVSPDPKKKVPLGYALAVKHLKYEDLPKKAKKWHDAGAWDQVDYYPVLKEYSYSSGISYEAAVKLGYLTKKDLSKKERAVIDAGGVLCYSTSSGKLSDFGMSIDQALKAGLIRESQIPADVKKSWKAGKHTKYYHTKGEYYHAYWE